MIHTDRKWLYIYGFAVLFFTFLSVIFIGVFRDDEFNEPGIFTKFPPTLKMYFYSPYGMQDIDQTNVNEDRMSEQKAFDEYVIRDGNQYPGDKYWYIPFILIQSMLTSLCCLLFFAFTRLQIKPYIILIHYFGNIVLLLINIILILNFDKWIVTILLIILTVSLNILTISLLNVTKLLRI